IHEELYLRVKDLRGKFLQDYRDIKQGNAYVVRNDREFDVLLLEILMHRKGSVHYIELINMYHKVKQWRVGVMVNYKPMKLEPEIYSLDSSQAIRILRNYRYHVQYPYKMVLNTEHYRAYKELSNFCHTMREMKRDPRLLPTLEQIAYRQEFVDYVIKLEAIGESEGVYQALKEQGDETLRAVFEPLKLLNQYLEVASTEQSSRDSNGQQVMTDVEELNSILNWSSTQIHKISE